MILVTGATGTVGGAVVKELERLGAKDVRVLVRDPQRAEAVAPKGFEIVVGDLSKPETLGAALEGVERVFLLAPPAPGLAKLETDFIEAAKRAGVRHVVNLSAIGADASAPEGFGRWHGQTEERLKSSGLAWTILQGNFFMQNLLGSARAVAEEGHIYLGGGDGRAGFVDARDIAAVAARTLIEDGHEGKTYVVTGPEALSYYDVAEKLSAVAGKEVKYVALSPEQFREGALAQGLPEWLVDALAPLNELLASNKASAVTDVVREVGKKEPTTFDQFARDHAQAFKGQ